MATAKKGHGHHNPVCGKVARGALEIPRSARHRPRGDQYGSPRSIARRSSKHFLDLLPGTRRLLRKDKQFRELALNEADLPDARAGRGRPAEAPQTHGSVPS